MFSFAHLCLDLCADSATDSVPVLIRQNYQILYAEIFRCHGVTVRVERIKEHIHAITFQIGRRRLG